VVNRALGMTTRDIAEHLHTTYGASVSHETIANITDAINDVVKEWRSRPLEEVYPILYIDAIRLRIRDGGAVRIKACHLVVGVDVAGRKRVLGMWIDQTEGGNDVVASDQGRDAQPGLALLRLVQGKMMRQPTGSGVCSLRPTTW
jgi:transposase-like protein